MTDTVPDMVCLSCLRPAHRVTDKSGSRWCHNPLGDDHEVAVAPRAEMIEVRNVCDFCCVPEEPVTWVYYTREEVNEILALQTDSGQVERHQFSGDRKTGGWINEKSIPGLAEDKLHVVAHKGWAACEKCAALIELRDVNRLSSRARRVGPGAMRTQTQGYYRSVWRPFFSDISHRTPLPGKEPG